MIRDVRFSEMKTGQEKKRNTMAYAAIVTIAVTLLIAGVPANTSAEGGSVGRGIELYRAGDHDAALEELKAVIDGASRAPLAYYYTAKIRYEKGQYSRAKGNLAAAIRDSAGFADAVGLLACAERKLGNTAAAVENWKKFTAAAGGTTSGGNPTPESIVTPEEYRAKLARLGKAAEKGTRPPGNAMSTAAAVIPQEKTLPADMPQSVPFGKYREAMPVIEYTTRHHAQKPVDATLDRPWVGGLINVLLGLVALFTVFVFLKFGKPVEEDDIPAEPTGRRWSSAPAPPFEPERGYRMQYGRSSRSKRAFVKKTEKKVVSIENLRDLRNRHAAEISRLMKRL